MNQLDQTTQQNAAASEESAASAEQMALQASALQGLVQDLTAVIDGVSLDESQQQHSDRGVGTSDGLSWSVPSGGMSSHPPGQSGGIRKDVFPMAAMHDHDAAPVEKKKPAQPPKAPGSDKSGGKKIMSSADEINKDF
jgi:hypothetical protein